MHLRIYASVWTSETSTHARKAHIIMKIGPTARKQNHSFVSDKKKLTWIERGDSFLFLACLFDKRLRGEEEKEMPGSNAEEKKRLVAQLI